MTKTELELLKEMSDSEIGVTYVFANQTRRMKAANKLIQAGLAKINGKRLLHKRTKRGWEVADYEYNLYRI